MNIRRALLGAGMAAVLASATAIAQAADASIGKGTDDLRERYLFLSGAWQQAR